MPRIVLLPNREDAPNWTEGIISRVFNRSEELPQYWRVNLEDAQRAADVDAFAYPTPFAWPEMMAAVLRQHRYDHYLFKLYDYLIRGLVLGHLQLDVVDLGAGVGGRFGSVLASTDGGFRYFGLLRTSPAARDLPQVVWGATSPESVFWPSPRRTDADWQALDASINRDTNLGHAYQVLADYRALLEQTGVWNPNSAAAPWMSGFNQVLESHRLNVKPSLGNKHFHVHSRLVGPVRVRLPDGGYHHLYVPVYEETFAAKFLRALTGTFKRDRDRVVITDGAGRACYEVKTPSVGPGGDVILAGAGAVVPIDEPSEELKSTQIDLRQLFSLVQDLHRAVGNDVADIKHHPFYYPDVFRIPVTRLGEAGLGGQVSFSDQAYKLTFDPNSPGLPLESELHTFTDETHGFVVPYRDESGQERKAIYVDTYAGAPVGDLRALGWVLWSYFTGEAEVRGGRLVDDELTPVFKEAGTTRPFDLRADIYEKVNGERDRHRRLATLQRFLRAYALLSGQSDGLFDKLCYEAASAFVKWVWPDRTFIENGHPPSSTQRVRLGAFEVSLARD